MGIPFFVSNRLDDEYDSLQKGYADLLAATLTNTSGIAVVSIDQARHVRWELDLSGDRVNGMTSLFVFGKFRIEPGREDENREMDLEVSIENGGEELKKFDYDNLPVKKAPETLIGPIASAIVNLASSGFSAPADLDAQAAMFGRRADELKKVNAVEESRALRESILLLAPDNVPQRLALVYDYLERLEPHRYDLESIRHALRHTRYLLRNRLVSMLEGVRIMRLLQWTNRPHSFDLTYSSELRHRYYPPEILDRFACAASLLPDLIRLSPGGRPRGHQGISGEEITI